MKHSIFILFLFMGTVVILAAQSDRPVSVGIHVLAGGRYDDVRMCVGSPEGVKGGPIAEIYFDVIIPLSDGDTLTVNIPVLRPVLFGVAFSMLQFEPQVTFEHVFPHERGKPGFLLSGGLGLVFHYGPDYKSSPENRGESFFAMGPLFTASAGVVFEGRSGTWIPGLKAFYAPLFSPDYSTGQVLGGGLEMQYRF